MRARRSKPGLISLLIAAAIALSSTRLHANDLVQASLLAEPPAISPGVPFTAAIRLRVPEHWHLSWRNPGDAGLPPTVRWQLPAQISAGPLQWPVPHAITTGPVTIYALDGDVWLLADLVPARGLPMDEPGPLQLAADVEWLVCSDLCIPEKARVQLSLPRAQTPSSNPGPDAALFAAARARLPRQLGFSAKLRRQDLAGGTAELEIDTAGLELAGLRGATAQFFPYAASAINPGAAQLMQLRRHGVSLTLARPEHASAELTELSGVLVLQGNTATDSVAAEISTGAPAPPALSGMPLWLALICAFAGGLILNLMPCVLPVIGFKVLSLIRDAGDTRRARLGGLAYSVGVVSSFWVLAGVLLAMRASGRALGWGFQMQSPAVVSLLAVLFFVCAVAFLGFFEIGFALQTKAGAVRFSSTGLGAFGSGVLATAVATPCTAPFMTVALGAALVSPPLDSLLIFTALGVGMAWPYALLSLWPALLRRIPKPGPWMVRLQQALAFPLFATVLWLLSVLSAQAGPRRVTATLTAMLVVGVALFLWRAFGGVAAPRMQRLGAGLAALVLALAGSIAAASPAAFVGAQADDVAPAPTGNQLVAHRDSPDADAEVAWQDWSPEKFAQLRAEKRWVFVDFTAAWCLTCQVNERLVFSSKDVRARFASLGVVPLRADWTRADPAITRALESFGRSGVPLNLIAGPGGEAPLVLPAVLTPGTVLDALSSVSALH